MAAVLAARHTHAMKRKQRGFSLAEVMLVMVMTGILSVGGITGWQKWRQQQRLWESVQQVRLFFEQQRSEANWKNTDHLFAITRPDSRWRLSSSGRGSGVAESESSLQLIQPFSDVDLVDMTPGLGFYGRRNTARPGHVTLRSPAGEWRVILSVWGRIRLCKTDKEE